MNSADSFNSQIYHVFLLTLVPFVVAFSFIVFILYRKRRESLFKQTAAELNHQVAEVEMKALRAQINPHFIFNCINSVRHFIHEHDLKNADEYLVDFSTLTRMVLENSVHKTISLKEDMQMVELYLQLEKICLDDTFDFHIHVDPALDVENTQVPPLIIQPFVENSIKHGFKTKQTQGCISIHVSHDGEMLKYLIEDNGEETIVSAKNKNDCSGIKKTSMGMSLIRERLEILNKTKKANARYAISDVRDEQNNYKGKRVELFLPFEEEV